MGQEDEEWEFDKRRGDLCEHQMIDGEELVWWEEDERFDNQYVKKTLRRTEGAMTFLVQREDETVLTVGTLMFSGDARPECKDPRFLRTTDEGNALVDSILSSEFGLKR